MFELVNVLLRRDPSTRLRSLALRTYRVVPLAPTAGLLQWVDGTMPLSMYLLGKADVHDRYGPIGAHERYRPRDMKSGDARKLMHAAHLQRDDHNSLHVYREIQKKLRPVLHHFFLERWGTPSAWFERRLAYGRSLAASSMAGFVLGLGDRCAHARSAGRRPELGGARGSHAARVRRHSSNILLDTCTAELVHIDLGIAFDQVRVNSSSRE